MAATSVVEQNMWTESDAAADSKTAACTALRNSQELGLQLRFAAEKGRVVEVRKLLSSGAPVLRDANGLNALHKAAKNGHSAVVKLLMACRRFNLNKADKYGWTPLHWAAWNGHVNAIQTLTSSSRCSINIIDKSGSNALHCAALNGHNAAIRVLVAAKCSPDLQRRDGWTPLHLSSWNGHHDAVRELIESKCKINARTEEGMGALHLAAAKGYDDIAQLVLEAGIAPDMQDKNGNTALHEATKWCQRSTIKVLVNAYCRTNMRNNDGHTPMDLARKEGHTDIAAELSGLGTNQFSYEDNASCAELRQLLFHDKMMMKSESPKNSKWILEVEERADSTNSSRWSSKIGLRSPFMLEERSSSNNSRKSSKIGKQSPFILEETWEEKLKSIQDEVRAKYESRIAEVKKSYQDKVDEIERRCSQQLSLMGTGLSDNWQASGNERSPSAPECQGFKFLLHTPSVTRADSL